MTRYLLPVLCLLLAYSQAWCQDDRSQIIKAYGSGVDEVAVHKAWALVQWSDGDAAGQALFHRLDGRWVSVFGGGGALVAANLFQYGVPRESWQPLLGRSLSAAELAQVSPGPYWIDWIRQNDLQDRDLRGHSDWVLSLMRNEIFAVHGRPFRDEEMRAYFGQRSWYHPDQAYSDKRLSLREARNARKIAAYQAARRP